MRLEIGWGATRRAVEVPEDTRVLRPPAPPAARDWPDVVATALAEPIDAPPLTERLRGLRRVCVVVPDRTRKDVAGALLPLLHPLLRGTEWTVGVASGKHPPEPVPSGAWAHDARAPSLVYAGTTARGTEAWFPPQVLDADLRIIVGEIRPHYFAGYAGGLKGLFPGVAGEAGIWHNHRLKAEPGARLGVVEGNPCRADMEAAAAFAGPSYLINVIRGPDGQPVDAVAGDPTAAHREGVRRARPVFEVDAGPRAPWVLVSDAHPVTANLYQACKLLAPAGALLRDGGTVVLAAACDHGIGPVDVINEGIYRLGIAHSLPPRHRVVLVSAQAPEAVAPTFAEHAPDVETALRGATDVVALPRAGDLVPVPR